MKKVPQATLPTPWLYTIMITLLIMLGATAAWALFEKRNADTARQATSSNHSDMTAEEALDTHGIVPLTGEQASNSTKTADSLAYLIEEEKLAHDVYQKLYEIWGSKVFSNISSSEQTHQNMVLATMQSRKLADPRASEAGKFTNPDLQKLYDQLITQGSRSTLEAYKVGKAIEELDIKDITAMLATLDQKDTDVRDVLTNLKQGSENHLRAFNRQIERS